MDERIGSDWDRLIRKARRRRARRFVLQWNRGMGDIALGLCQVVDELRAEVTDAEITVITRPDLAEAVQLLNVDRVIVDAAMTRHRQEPLHRILRRLAIDPSNYDVVVSRIDPTRWFGRKPRAQPRLNWPTGLDHLSRRFDGCFDGCFEAAAGSPLYVGIHAQCETASFYSYQKDWPIDSWIDLFARLRGAGNVRFVLFGHRSDVRFDDPCCIDLRGKTSFLEMMALIKRRCSIVIGPDSGVLTMTYYLGDQFPIGVISLWADPRQGILKQGAPSPNRLLRHVPMLSVDEKVASIPVEDVTHAFEALLQRVRDAGAVTADGSRA